MLSSSFKTTHKAPSSPLSPAFPSVFVLYIFTTTLLIFNSILFGLYHQLHYPSATKSHNFLNMYPLGPALPAAVGDIYHLLKSQEKKKKGPNCDAVCLPARSCESSKTLITSQQWHGAAQRPSVLWLYCQQSSPISQKTQRKRAHACLSYVSRKGDDLTCIHYQAHSMWSYPSWYPTED